MENVIVQKAKQQFRNLKALSEELEVQMALGKAEARDLMESEKKQLSKFMSKQRQQITKDGSSMDVDRREFLTAIEMLESNLNSAVPQATGAYDAYKAKTLETIYKVEELVRSSYQDASLSFQKELDSFKAKMDAFRVNLALHDQDNPAKVQKIKNEFSEKLVEIRSILAKNEQDHTKVDNFVEDITESFNYLKRAINDLSK